jgi:hypothetical protein
VGRILISSGGIAWTAVGETCRTIRTSYSASWASSPGTLVTDSAISPTLSVPRKTTDGRISSAIA